MKKIFFTLALILILQNCAFASKSFYNDKNLWGIKDNNGEVLVEPQYKKLIILGENTYIVQKRGKFGVIDNNNNIIVPIKIHLCRKSFRKVLKTW